MIQKHEGGEGDQLGSDHVGLPCRQLALWATGLGEPVGKTPQNRSPWEEILTCAAKCFSTRAPRPLQGDNKLLNEQCWGKWTSTGKRMEFPYTTHKN